MQKNESLLDVAQKNGIRLEYLYEYNGLQGTDPNSYRNAGSRLKLKPVAKEQTSLVKNEPVSASVKTYAVQPKEGLFAISKKHGITVAQLKEWNNLTGDNLQIGQQLIVSK